MKKKILLMYLLIALVPHLINLRVVLAQPVVDISSQMIYQGDLGIIEITVKKHDLPQVIWMGKEVYLSSNREKTDWVGFLTADLAANPGQYKAVVKVLPSGDETKVNVEIRRKDYGVRRLTLPKKMVDLDPKVLKRVKKESRIMRNLWATPPTIQLWRGAFVKPVQGMATGAFGKKSIINNQPRSPHSGVDLKAEKGTPIMAMNNGKVVLIGEHFFTGRSIVIDHGGGIKSMYFHLEKTIVAQGDRVQKGQVIGLVGSSGRATGPHLHWGVRINGARVNPLSLVSLSPQLKQW